MKTTTIHQVCRPLVTASIVCLRSTSAIGSVAVNNDDMRTTYDHGTRAAGGEMKGNARDNDNNNNKNYSRSAKSE